MPLLEVEVATAEYLTFNTSPVAARVRHVAAVVGADFTFVAEIQPAIHLSAVLYRVQEAGRLPLALFVGVSRSGTWVMSIAHTL